MKRRSFLIGAASLVAAPAIIRVADLMKISPLPYDPVLVKMGAAKPGHHWEVALGDGRVISTAEIRASHVKETAKGVYLLDRAVILEVPDTLPLSSPFANFLSPNTRYEILNCKYIPDEKLADPKEVAQMVATIDYGNPLLTALARSPGSELYMAGTDTSRFQQRRS